MKKRIISFLLAFAMLVTTIPSAVFAAPSDGQPSLDTGEVSVQGTNELGSLISSDLVQVQEDQLAEVQAGYSISNLVFEGNTARVSVYTMEDAQVVVAVYSEDGLRLLTSAVAEVSADESEVLVTFEEDLPDYFMASAYLVDLYDFSPLSPAFDTPMYTQEMQELLASTVEDYDEELVVNLDEDTNTNFAVFAETTKVIEFAEGVNNVASFDRESAIYVITNADEQFTTLQEGDVFAYAYCEDDMLIGKVGKIEVKGKKVTIIGDELDVSEVFSHLKIEADGQGAEASLDTETAANGVSRADHAAYSRKARASEGSASNEFSFGFNVDFAEKGSDALKLQIQGGLSLSGTIAVEYYISWNHQRARVDLEATVKMEGQISVSSKWSPEIPLGVIYVPVLPCVSVEFSPSLVVEVSASLTFSVEVKNSIGFTIDHEGKRWDHQSFHNAPEVNADVELEGSLFIGVELEPAVELVYALDVEVEGKIGAEITGHWEPYTGDSGQEKIHTCRRCISGDVNFVIQTSLGVELFELEALSYEISLLNFSRKLFDWYSCSEHGAKFMRRGTCPDYQYRLTVAVVDIDGIEGADISVGNKTGVTDASGYFVTYLPEGKYTVSAKKGIVDLTETVVLDEAKLLILDGMIRPDFSAHKGKVEDSSGVQDFGAEMERVRWRLENDGTLVIYGKGAMSNGIENNHVYPWTQYRDRVTRLVIEDGVTSVGYGAFTNFSNIKYLQIPADIQLTLNATNFGTASPFYGCSNIEEIRYTYGQTGVMSESDTYHPAFISRYNLKRASIDEGITRIGSKTFSSCTKLLSVNVPGTLKEIGDKAFENCSSLVSISLPNGVTTIGSYAFYSCTSLPELNVTNKLTKLGEGAFRYCSSLTELHVSSGLTKIPDFAFANCSSVEAFVIPDSVTSIGYSAFAHCGGMKKLTLPADAALVLNRTNYGTASPFTESGNVEEIRYTYGKTGVISENSTYYPAFISRYHLKRAYIDEGITRIGSNTFSYCSKLVSVDIPDSLKEIGDKAFENCSSLVSISLPNGVTTIGSYAFYSCTSLPELNVTDNLTKLGEGAFRYCSSLTELHVSAGLTAIPDFAFANCSSVEAFVIPDSVARIGYCAFAHCTGMKKLTVPADAELILNRTNYGTTSPFTESVYVEEIRYTYGQTGVISENTTYYPAFISRYNLQRAYIDEGITRIGSNTFSYCSKLVSVDIPESLVEIGDKAFENCSSLVTAELPDNVTAIGCNAFYGCTSLPELNVTDNLTKLGEGAFRYCSSLTELHVSAGLTKIPDFAFANCSSVEAFVIPDSVTSIGYSAFAHCGGMKKLTLPADAALVLNRTNFGTTSPFTDSGNVEEIRYTYGQTGVISENTTYYPAYISRYNLQRAYIDEGITRIGSNTFSYCSMLVSVDVPESLVEIGDKAFENCSSLENIELPDGVTTIGSYAFYSCTSLPELHVTDNLTKLGEGAFRYCSSLTELHVSSGLTKIPDFAFANCSSVEAFVIPDSVTSIGYSAFAHCGGMKKLTLPADAELILNRTNYGTTSPFTDSGNVEEIRYTYGKTGVISGSNSYYPAYISGANLKNVYIDKGITEISDAVFKFCNKLTDLYFGGSEAEWKAMIIGSSNDILEQVTIHFDFVMPEPAPEPEPTEPTEPAPEEGTEPVEPEPTEPEPEPEEIPEPTEPEPAEPEDEEIPEVTEPAPVEPEPTEPEKPDETEESDEIKAPAVDQVYPGDYESVFTDEYVVKYASFTGLVPGEQYVMYAMTELDNEDLLNPDKLLFIEQGVAGEDGTLRFKYVQRVETVVSYVIACGASNKNLADAEITFPTMVADGNLQIVEPTVVYNGETLINGVDYTIVGRVDFTEAGKYTCYIRGVHNYAGLITCPYTVYKEAPGALNIITQPENFVGVVGDMAAFTVEADREDVTYQWYFSKDSGETWEKSNCTTNTISVEFKAYRLNYLYRCEVTDADGNTVVSESAALRALEQELVIVTQPVNYVGAVNDDVTFTVEATGNGLTYEWFFSTDGGETWEKSYSPGYASNTLCPILRTYRDGNMYKCVVTDVLGSSVESDAVSMTVQAGDIVIITQPQPVINAISGQLYGFSVEAEGDNLTYRWELSTDDGDTWQESWNQGYNTANLSVRMNPNRDGNLYRCCITSGLKVVAYTDVVMLDMQDPSVEILGQSGNVFVTANKAATFTVEAEGMDLTYLWYRSNDKGATWNQTYLSGYNTNTLSFVANANRAAMYMCKITDGSGTVAWSEPVKLQILSAELKILNQPVSTTCAAGETVTFHVEAQGDSLKYQWYSFDGVQWKMSYLPGYNTETLSFTVNVTRAMKIYKCVITDVAGNTVETDSVSVAIK